MEAVKLGQLIGEHERRDAVHVAVEPMIAPVTLKPGQHVDQLGRPAGKTGSDPAVGIVDPFLIHDVPPGCRFWLCLYPGTTLSLRHEWTHVAFGQGASDGDPVKAESEKWLREYSMRVSYYDDPETAYRNLINGAIHGEILYHGSDLHSYSDLEEPDELFRHLGNLLGRSFNRHSFIYGCSC